MDICSELKQHGLAIRSIYDVLPVERWVPLAAQAYEFANSDKVQTGIKNFAKHYQYDPGVGNFQRKVDGSTKKDFLVMKFDRTDAVSLISPIMQAALYPALLQIAKDYLGVKASLNQINYWYTIPLNISDRPRLVSQNWHRDPEALKLLKVFIYYSDVDKDSGALEYVLRSRPNEFYDKSYPRSRFATYLPVDAEIDPTDCVMATGAKGTIVFCDTGGIHRGGFCMTRPRLSSIFSYTPPDIDPRFSKQFRYDANEVAALQ